MKNSKLIDILRTFSKEEMKEFGKFISSPYFGCRKFIINFFGILKKYYPEFKDEDIEKKKLFREMYKDKKFNDGLMRRINSEIIKYALEFLTLRKFKEISAFSNNCLLMELRDRKLDKLFVTKSDQIIKELDKSKVKDLYILLDKYLTEIEIYNYKSMMNKPDMFLMMETIHESIIYLISYLLFNNADKLKLIEYKFKKNICKEFEKQLISDKLFEITGSQSGKNLTIFRASFFAYNIIRDKLDEKSYLQLKKILTNEKDCFTKNQLRTFYSYIFYFYNYYISKNNEKYIKDEYEVYQLILREDLFLNYSPFMSIFFCRNYVNACRRVDEPNSIQQFIDSYSQYFIPENRDNIINYSKAIIMFIKNEFGKTLEYSSLINLDLPQFKNDIKVLKIKCYYEMGYADSLINEMDSLNHFYRNLKKDSHKLQNIGYLISVGSNFLKHFNSFLRLTDKFSADQKNILIKEIENETLLNEKKWLLEKVNELKK